MDSKFNSAGGANVEQVENQAKTGPPILDASLNPSETVSYGEQGIKGLISSPYIFGAALLASMGGFSFGYDQLRPPLPSRLAALCSVTLQIGPRREPGQRDEPAR